MANHYLRSYSLGEEAGDLYIMARASTHLGDLYKVSGQLPQAEARYKTAAELFGSIKSEHDTAWVSRKQGTLALFHGDWKTALIYLRNSLASFKKLNDTYEQARVKDAMGWAEALRGNWDLALQYHSDALESYQHHQFPDEYRLMKSHLHIGNDYYTQGQLSKAQEFFNTALQKSNELREGLEKGFILLGLAKVARASTRLHKCRPPCTRSAPILCPDA